MAYLDKSGDWGGRFAPTVEELESLARAAYAKLPERLRQICRDVTVHVADFADDNIMEDMGLDSPFEILSLYEGPGLQDLFSMPAANEEEKGRIWLFRRPILDYWAENEETLDEILSYLLIRELSRPFGLSDEDMDAANNLM